MPNRSELHFIVFLVLYKFSTAYDVTVLSKADQSNANFCYWINSTANGLIHYSFLHQSAGIRPNALHLFFSTWTEDQRLVDCVISKEQVVTESYLSLCRERCLGNFLASSEARLNLTLLLAPGSPCVDVNHSEPVGRSKRDVFTADPRPSSPTSSVNFTSGPEVRRRKRSWVFPGTLWCGMGTKAIDYEEIGMFGKTDSCCREHDHCKNIIPAFRVNYGVFNHNFFTVSHCDCDQRFRECLQGVNDTISHMVGYSFFNVLKVPCFKFMQRKHCTQLSWWGLCKSVQVAPYAVFRNSPLYHSSLKDQVDQESGVTRIPESTTATPQPSTTALGDGTLPPALACPTRGHKHKPPKPGRHCTLRGPLRGDTFWPSQKRGAGKGVANKGGPPFSPSRRGDHKGTPMGWKAGAKATNASPMQRTTAAVTTTPSTSAIPVKKTTPSRVRPAKGRAGSTSATPVSKTTPSRVRPAKGRAGSTSAIPVNKTTPSRVRPAKRRAGSTSATPVSKTTPSRVRPAKGRAGSTSAIPVNKTTPSRVRPAKRRAGSTSATPVSETTPLRVRPAKRRGGSTQLGSENALPTDPPWSQRDHPPKNLPAPLQANPYKDKLQLCDCYKQLDECRYKILPQEVKYGLHNEESKILYHCSCTRRLARQLRSLEEPSAVQSLLVDFVSLSCFTLPRIRHCPRQRRCLADLSESAHLKRALKRMTGDLGGSTLKVKRQSTAKARGKGLPVNMYKRCLRITGKNGQAQE